MTENTENAEVAKEEIDSSTAQPETDLESLRAEVESLRQENKELAELKEFKEKYFYQLAEMENFRKRAQREKENLVKFGNEKILSGLLDVLDNFDRTVDAIRGDNDEKVKNISIGIDMVGKQFLQFLRENGLEVIECLGQKFDPNLHEALSQRADKDKEDETIVEVFQKGYLLNGRLLRASKVVIVKN